LKDLLQNKIDDLEKQVLSRVNGLEEGKPGLRNESEQRGRVESTLTSLHQRITDLEKGNRWRFCSTYHMSCRVDVTGAFLSCLFFLRGKYS